MANPIRVAQIVGKMNGGGVEAVVMNYYRHIDRSKVQFDFLVDSDSTLVPREEIESLGGRVFEIPPYQHVIEYQRELHRLFEQEGWKIVHSHINALSVFPLRAAKFPSFRFARQRRPAFLCVSPIATLRVVRVSMPRTPLRPC